MENTEKDNQTKKLWSLLFNSLKIPVIIGAATSYYLGFEFDFIYGFFAFYFVLSLMESLKNRTDHRLEQASKIFLIIGLAILILNSNFDPDLTVPAIVVLGIGLIASLQAIIFGWK